MRFHQTKIIFATCVEVLTSLVADFRSSNSDFPLKVTGVSKFESRRNFFVSCIVHLQQSDK